MTARPELTRIDVPQLALRLHAERCSATYAVYLVPADQVGRVLADLGDELSSFAPPVTAIALRPATGAQLMRDLAATATEAVLVDAAAFGRLDWSLVDRRRSSLSRAAVVVLVTTPDSFGQLMQAAPNLASWLGALAFQYEDPSAQESDLRGRRLAALRSWAQRSDEDVVRAAGQGRLPADPEYAEWLVLLGRSDLLVPAPLMTPSELLAVFIEGAQPPSGRAPRTPTAFEAGWHEATHALAKR
jgi:hypothetical protein